MPPDPPTRWRGRTVTVAGAVRLFSRAEFERDYSWFSIISSATLTGFEIGIRAR